MTTSKTDTGNMNEFLLKKPGSEKSVDIMGRYWHVTRILISDVCMVAELEPGENFSLLSKDGERTNMKKELYRLLRGIANRAMDRDVMRPMVGYIRLPENRENWENWEQVLSDWEADQDWHQGDFLLFHTTGSHGIGTEKKRLFQPPKNSSPTSQMCWTAINSSGSLRLNFLGR